MPLEKILVIEDEALIARELKGRLTNMGWDVWGWPMARRRRTRETDETGLVSFANIQTIDLYVAQVRPLDGQPISSNRM